MNSIEKAALRKAVSNKLKGLDPDKRLSDSRQASSLLLESDVWASSKGIFLFASTVQEPETSFIAADALKKEKKIFYPRTIDSNGGMELRLVASLDQLKAGRWGILEPTQDCPLVALGEVDFVLVPGLAFDRVGSRLGRGGGYYDRILGHRDCKAIKVGYFFSLQEVPLIPVDDHDQKVDWILTERELFKL